VEIVQKLGQPVCWLTVVTPARVRGKLLGRSTCGWKWPFMTPQAVYMRDMKALTVLSQELRSKLQALLSRKTYDSHLAGYFTEQRTLQLAQQQFTIPGYISTFSHAIATTPPWPGWPARSSGRTDAYAPGGRSLGPVAVAAPLPAGHCGDTPARQFALQTGYQRACQRPC
jgi:hypothetical protein